MLHRDGFFQNGSENKIKEKSHFPLLSKILVPIDRQSAPAYVLVPMLGVLVARNVRIN